MVTRFRFSNTGNGKKNEIKHNLNFLKIGQGGLLDVIHKNNIIWIAYTEIREEWEDIIGHINFKEADPVQWQKFITVNNNLDISLAELSNIYYNIIPDIMNAK